MIFNLFTFYYSNFAFFKKMTLSFPLPFPLPFPFAVHSRCHVFHAREKLAERCRVGKMQPVGYLGNAELRCLQQERGFHEQHLVDVVDDGSSRHLAHHA